MQATYRSVSAAVGRVEMAAVQSSDGPMNKSNIYIKIWIRLEESAACQVDQC